MKEYWCVICENCHPLIAIPLLEYDPTKQRQNPHDFQVTCFRCQSTSAFDETEIEVRKMERVPAFSPPTDSETSNEKYSRSGFQWLGP